MDWQVFAWQGFEMPVPAAWDPSVLDGDRRRGFCRLRDDERVRCEMRWERTLHRDAVARAASRAGAALQRRWPKSSLRMDIRLPAPPDSESRCFRCVAGEEVAVGLAARRKGADRVAVVCLFSERGSGLGRTARRILAGFRDEARGETQAWAVYGFRLATPRAYVLRDCTFVAGCLTFAFGARGRRAEIRREAPADVRLRETPLEEWCRMRWPQEFARSRVQIESVGGRRRVWAERRSRRLLQKARLTVLAGVHDAGANALYGVCWTGGEDHRSEARALVESLGSSRL